LIGEVVHLNMLSLKPRRLRRASFSIAGRRGGNIKIPLAPR
jgi:hypothetical protein